MNFGSNSFIWILFLLLLIPGGFNFGNSCGGCGSSCDGSFLLLIILLLMMQGGNCGICEAK